MSTEITTKYRLEAMVSADGSVQVFEVFESFDWDGSLMDGMVDELFVTEGLASLLPGEDAFHNGIDRVRLYTDTALLEYGLTTNAFLGWPEVRGDDATYVAFEVVRV